VSKDVAASTRPEPWSNSPSLGWPAKVRRWPSLPSAPRAGTAWSTSPSAPGCTTSVSRGDAGMAPYYP
jgi:hypothetical protein